MIEKVFHVSSEIAAINYPALKGNRQTELLLFITLAAQGQKGEALVGSKFEQRAGNGCQRRGLIVAAIESAQDPIQARQTKRCADARVGHVLGNRPGKVRQAPPA